MKDLSLTVLPSNSIKSLLFMQLLRAVWYLVIVFFLMGITRSLPLWKENRYQITSLKKILVYQIISWKDIHETVCDIFKKKKSVLQSFNTNLQKNKFVTFFPLQRERVLCTSSQVCPIKSPPSASWHSLAQSRTAPSCLQITAPGSAFLLFPLQHTLPTRNKRLVSSEYFSPKINNCNGIKK